MFPWMREGRKTSLQPVVIGVARLREDHTRTNPFSGSAPHSRGQELSQAKAEERISAWYQGFPRGQRLRMKTKL